MKNLTTTLNIKSQINTLLLALIFILASCSTSTIDPIVLLTGDEKINLFIDGEIESVIQLSSNDLVSYNLNTAPIVESGEYDLLLDLGNGAQLRVTIYNEFESNPLNTSSPYPAFSNDLIQGNAAYIIGSYIVNGEEAFSTISEFKQGLLQTNALISEDKDSHYSIFIENLLLFATDKDISNPSEVSISLTGTFTVNK